MASIDTRTRKDGTVAHRIRWRYAGKRDGALQSLTYDHPDDAKKMKGAIEARGHLVYDTDPAVLDFSLVTGMRDHTYTSPTFGQVAERWISSRTRASAASRDHYRRTVTYKLGALVNRPIEAVTDDEIRCVLTGIIDQGMSARHAYDVTGSVFKFAMNKGMLPGGNPCALVEKPRKRGRHGVFLTPSEARLLLDHCAAYPTAATAAALSALTEAILGTGLRISEALGLLVADVHVDDLDAAWLDIEYQLNRPTKKDPEFRRIRPKTDAGLRRVVLDRDTAELFSRLVDGKRPNEPVFEHPTRGGWWPQYLVNKAWAWARDKARDAGLSKTPRVHDLRHTHAAWLITDGVPLLAVSRRLGHESIVITADVYGHLLPEADTAIRDAVSARRAAMGTARKAPTKSKRGTRRPANRKSTDTAPASRTAPERTTGGTPSASKAGTRKATGTAA